MKIAVLGLRGFPNIQGGIEAHCENLYPWLVKSGCEIIVFTRKPYINPSITKFEGIKLIPLSCPKNKFLEAIVHTFKGVLAARKLRPDILHIHGIGPSIFVPFASLLDLKVVMTNHGPDYKRKKWNSLAKMVLKIGERLGTSWSNEIICISKVIANDIKKKHGRDSYVIPNGVKIYPITNSKQILEKYSLIPQEYILAVGRLVPEKGFDYLIDAFEEFQNKILKINAENWKLVIVGRADHEDRYSLELKEKAKNNNDIILTGFLTGEPLQELYSHAGIFVLPSYYEGLPIVLLEAMSYGLSCISSDIQANRNVELSEDRFFKAGRTTELAVKINKYVNNPLTAKERTKQINMIAKKYDWENIGYRTLDVYRKVIGYGV